MIADIARTPAPTPDTTEQLRQLRQLQAKVQEVLSSTSGPRQVDEAHLMFAQAPYPYALSRAP